MTHPTEKMIKFAKAIVKELYLPEPNYNDYDEVSEFINKNKDAYYQRKYDNGEM